MERNQNKKKLDTRKLHHHLILINNAALKYNTSSEIQESQDIQMLTHTELTGFKTKIESRLGHIFASLE